MATVYECAFTEDILTGSNSDFPGMRGIVVTGTGSPAEFYYLISWSFIVWASGEIYEFADLQDTDLSLWLIEQL